MLYLLIAFIPQNYHEKASEYKADTKLQSAWLLLSFFSPWPKHYPHIPTSMSLTVLPTSQLPPLTLKSSLHAISSRAFPDTAHHEAREFKLYLSYEKAVLLFIITIYTPIFNLGRCWTSMPVDSYKVYFGDNRGKPPNKK